MKVLNPQMYSNPGAPKELFYAPESVEIEYKNVTTEAEVDTAIAS